jgi:hypothetical protein
MQVNALFKKAAPAPAKTAAPAKKSLFGAKKAAAAPAPAKTVVKKTAPVKKTVTAKKPAVKKATPVVRKAAPSKIAAKGGDSKWYGTWVRLCSFVFWACVARGWRRMRGEWATMQRISG